MQDLRFSALAQQGFEVWPTTHSEKSEVGHQFFALQTTLKPALGVVLTHSNEKPRVSAIWRSASEGGRAKMQNYLNIISIAKEMTKNKRILICQGSNDKFILTRLNFFVNPQTKLFFPPMGQKVAHQWPA